MQANNLTKVSSEADRWDAGTRSSEVISGNGRVSTTVAETDTDRVIGLSSEDSGVGYTDIDFAIRLDSTGRIDIYENGLLVRSNLASYDTGDVVSIQRSGAQIDYLLNGSVIYTSTEISTGNLHVNTSLFSNGATLNNIVIDDGAVASSDNYQVLTATPTITIDDVGGDNAIDGIEAGRDQLVTGSASGIAEGETITVSLNGNNYSAVVNDGVWAAVIPASALVAGSITASYTNAAGATANASQAITLDAAPLTISLDDSELLAGETATVTFTFAEAVTDFGLDDISVASGSLSNLQSSDGGVTWTAVLTPEAGVDQAENAISVNANWRFVSGNPVPTAGGEFAVTFAGNYDPATTQVYGNSLSKIGVDGWASTVPALPNGDVDSGAFSDQAIHGDGYLATTLVGDGSQVGAIGLSSANANDSLYSMDYAVSYGANGKLSFYQNGTLQLSADVSAVEGDELKLAVNDGVVSVLLNDALVHSFTQNSNGAPLHADVALYSTGAAFDNIVMSDDAVAASANYDVDTESLLSSVAASGNTVTVAYSADLSALYTPSASSFEVAVDGAGRQVTAVNIFNGQLQVTFSGDALADDEQLEFSYTATGSNQLQDLAGGLMDNIGNAVVGNGNLTTLTGTRGADTIVGSAGDDVITGNQGNDVLFGMAGADTFDYNRLTNGNGTDTIMDFETGAGGDVIDLSDLLVGYESGTSDLADFIIVDTVSETDDTLALRIDTDGVSDVNSDPFSPNLTIVLDNISAADVNLSTFVDDLNTNGNIVL